MKKIAIVAPWVSGHVQRWIAPMIGEYEFHVFTLHPEGGEMEGVHLHSLKRLTGTRLDFVFARGQLRRAIAELKPDLVHAHFLSSYGIMAAELAHPVKALSLWGTDVNGKSTSNPLIRRLCRWALPRYDYINAAGGHLGDKVETIAGRPLPIETYQYGVECGRLPQRQRDAEGRVQLASFRNWDDLYHINDLLRGYAAYCRDHDDACLHLYGRGNATKTAEIESLIEQLGFGEGQISVAGFTPREQLMAELAKMDVMLSIPDKDGTPLSLLESMVIGLLPVVSDLDAVRDWLGEDEAVFVEGYSAEQVARAIAEAVRRVRSGEHISAAEANRARVFDRGDYATNTARLQAAYQRLLP